MKVKVLVCLMCFMVIYLALGGTVFYYLQPWEDDESSQVNKTNFLKVFQEMYPDVNHTHIEELRSYFQNIEDDNILTEEEERFIIIPRFSLNLLLSFGIISTIGYGSIAPIGHISRLFCVFYAIVGIPVSMLTLAGMGEKLKKAVCFIEKKMKKSKIYNSKNPCFNIGFILVVLTVLFLLVIPVSLFAYLEEWDIISTIYFVVVTVSTIGFGDIIPTLKRAHGIRSLGMFYIILLLIWTYCSLAWVSMIINFAINKIRLLFEQGKKDSLTITPDTETEQPLRKSSVHVGASILLKELQVKTNALFEEGKKVKVQRVSPLCPNCGQHMPSQIQDEAVTQLWDDCTKNSDMKMLPVMAEDEVNTELQDKKLTSVASGLRGSVQLLAYLHQNDISDKAHNHMGDITFDNKREISNDARHHQDNKVEEKLDSVGKKRTPFHIPASSKNGPILLVPPSTKEPQDIEGYVTIENELPHVRTTQTSNTNKIYTIPVT